MMDRVLRSRRCRPDEEEEVVFAQGVILFLFLPQLPPFPSFLSRFGLTLEGDFMRKVSTHCLRAAVFKGAGEALPRLQAICFTETF